MSEISYDNDFIKTIFFFFFKNGRHDLLWRKDITPYKILVSEVMLQQTQVERVLTKFSFWMKKYPTLASLKKASLTDVLILWQGLGYQRRAKGLFLVAATQTKIPSRYEELLLLPGVGPYTASAVTAFAFDTFNEHPLIETNIRTVIIEHFYGEREVVTDKEIEADLKRLAEHPVVKKHGARAWYYALMDYGAHLKKNAVSHNIKSAHYKKQTPYKGSLRELRAKVLFAITHKKDIPKDERVEKVLDELTQEGFIKKTKKTYSIL